MKASLVVISDLLSGQLTCNKKTTQATSALGTWCHRVILQPSAISFLRFNISNSDPVEFYGFPLPRLG